MKTLLEFYKDYTSNKDKYISATIDDFVMAFERQKWLSIKGDLPVNPEKINPFSNKNNF